MLRRFTAILSLATALALLAGCHHNKVSNPIANVDSKQPDKVLFDRSMDAMQHGKYDVARMTLQTLINTYPDSEFIARAKLAVGDSWYAEGTSAAYQQAEEEYKQFQVFFPNMAEAAEAQKKIGDIHYKQMEKADRDPTQALEAEDAYRQLILQYPDSKLVPNAKERLREVQEVLADREFEIGHFYYVRGAYPAAIARLKTLSDSYPLYSQVDEALFLLGTAYEKEAEYARNAKPSPEMLKIPDSVLKKKAFELFDANKEATSKHFADLAAESYAKLVTDYPVMDRSKDAKDRLAAMHRPVPTPTKEAIARNKAEQESRGNETMFGHFLDNFHHAPSMVAASHVGDPTLDQPQETSAKDIVDAATSASTAAIQKLLPVMAPGGAAPATTSTSNPTPSGGNGTNASTPGGTSSGTGTSTVGVEPVGKSSTGNSSEAQPAVQPATQLPGANQPAIQPNAQQPAAGEQPKVQQPDNGIDELKPIAPPETTPAPGTGGNAQPPAQIKTGITSQDSQQGSSAQQSSSSSQQDQAQQGQQPQQDQAQSGQNNSDQASSKSGKKKKKNQQQPQQPPR